MLGLQAKLTPQTIFDAVDDGANLPVGGSTADDEEVGDVAETAEIQHHDVVGLLVQCGFDGLDDLGRCLGGQRRPSFSR